MNSPLPILVFLGGFLIVIVVRLILPTMRSQSGAGGNRPWSEGWSRDDDRYWIGNLIYNNPDDPAVFVPKRFGIGWTLNLGRPLGKAILAATLLLPPVLIVLKALSRSS